uniref:hypothetical protein n=1 Tax=Escherichia coli TaxID=562 RepID=UPI001954FA4A
LERIVVNQPSLWFKYHDNIIPALGGAGIYPWNYLIWQAKRDVLCLLKVKLNLIHLCFIWNGERGLGL